MCGPPEGLNPGCDTDMHPSSFVEGIEASKFLLIWAVVVVTKMVAKTLAEYFPSFLAACLITLATLAMKPKMRTP